MATGQTRKTMQGVVLRRSGEQSVVVRVERMVMHAQFKKYLRRHRNVHVHDPMNKCQVGDMVMVQESRPISKTKRWLYVGTL
ncbi:MAG: 30S ribosomal protein S17 [Deltaproteobacteria bacterium]|nr:30S ribosomal protein S17 [Deltaproteobacteria bacterium]